MIQLFSAGTKNSMDGMSNVSPADLDKVLRELRDAMQGLRVNEGLREASTAQLEAELQRRRQSNQI